MFPLRRCSFSAKVLSPFPFPSSSLSFLSSTRFCSEFNGNGDQSKSSWGRDKTFYSRSSDREHSPFLRTQKKTSRFTKPNEGDQERQNEEIDRRRRFGYEPTEQSADSSHYSEGHRGYRGNDRGGHFRGRGGDFGGRDNNRGSSFRGRGRGDFAGRGGRRGNFGDRSDHGFRGRDNFDREGSRGGRGGDFRGGRRGDFGDRGDNFRGRDNFGRGESRGGGRGGSRGGDFRGDREIRSFDRDTRGRGGDTRGRGAYNNNRRDYDNERPLQRGRGSSSTFQRRGREQGNSSMRGEEGEEREEGEDYAEEAAASLEFLNPHKESSDNDKMIFLREEEGSGEEGEEGESQENKHSYPKRNELADSYRNNFRPPPQERSTSSNGPRRDYGAPKNDRYPPRKEQGGNDRYPPRRDYETSSDRYPRRESNRNERNVKKGEVPAWKEKSNKISQDQIVGIFRRYLSDMDGNAPNMPFKLEDLAGRYEGSFEAFVADGDFLYGPHSVSSAIARDRRTIHGILTDKPIDELRAMSSSHEQIVSLAIKRKIPILFTSTGRLENLSGGFGNRHSSIILVCSMFEPIEHNVLHSYDSELVVPLNDTEQLVPPHRFEIVEEKKIERMPVWLVLDRIQDPHNMGALLRSAWFYGIDGVILPLKKSCPINATCANISTGAVEQVPLYFCRDLSMLIKQCKENDWQTVGTFSNAGGDTPSSIVSLEDVTVKKPTIITLGNEGKGVSHSILKYCNQSISINKHSPPSLSFLSTFEKPQHEIDLSLNVSVAAGVIMNHLALQSKLD